MSEPTATQVESLISAMREISVQGTPIREYEAGYGGYTTYTFPWYVVDTGKAEPDVNYPGDLISTHKEWSKANHARATEIAKRLLSVKE
jgi:hypothetical protein